jgi:hypothetical protein
VHRVPRRLAALLPVLLVLQLLSVAAPADVAAVGGTFYVDGKNGSDASNGLSLGTAFRTIARAAGSVPTGSAAAGWRIRVVGYTDYVYRERPIPPGWDRGGTSAAPIVFEALGYNGTTGGYVRPIVSGADAASGWTPVQGRAGVWSTAWATKPQYYGQLSGSFTTVVLQDTTMWLWEQPHLDALEARADANKGGYVWSGGKLYVAPVGGGVSSRTFDVITRSAFYFDGRYPVANVQVRGFEVRHSVSGIAFRDGVDGGAALHNRLIGNLFMGVAVDGEQTPSGPDPAIGTRIEGNTAAYNTLQAFKLDAGSVSSTVCDNDVHHNGLQGIKVQGPPSGSAYTGTTSGNVICRNDLHLHDFNPTGSVYNNASGLTIANGARTTTVRDNRIWANDVGIHVAQESSGLPAIQDTVVTRNDVWSNRRFGLNLYDGRNGSGAGRLTSSRNLYWDNGIGVMADLGLANKVLDHDTVWWNRTDGVRVGGSASKPTGLTIKGSLITHNRQYGVWLQAGGSASITYTGLYGNVKGSIVGSPSSAHLNTQPPGFLSTSTADPGFLTVASDSYQYTAGAGSTPIGARWAEGFIDIASSLFRNDILWLAASGITSGCGGDYFCPKTNVTRGQMAAFLDRGLELDPTSADFFTDDESSIFEANINRLAAANITKGCTATTFCPDATITREQMAAFLDRALDLPPTNTDFFTDDTSSIFEASINRLAASGITSGCTASTFCGKALVTREQMAAFLHRALD